LAKKRTVQEFDRRLDQIEQAKTSEPTKLSKLQREFDSFSKIEAVPSELAQRFTRVVRGAWRRFAEEILSACEQSPVPDQGLLNTLRMVREIYDGAGEERLPDGKFANYEIESRLDKLAALVPRTGREQLTHPALGHDFTPSPTARRGQARSGVPARSARRARVEPFLEDQFDVSRTQFRRMRKDQKRELMVEWFRQNYEDGSAEDYDWTGKNGPCDAEDELFNKFGHMVSLKLIYEAAREVGAGGIEKWASLHDEDYQDDDLLEDLTSLDDYSDEPTEQFGSAQDLAARERARAVLQDLLAVLNAPKEIGIGHNNPPEKIDDKAIEALRKDVVALHAEFGKPNPSISFVKKLGIAIGKAALASIKWAGKKVDLAINTTILTGIPAIGAIVGVTYNDQIHKVIDVVRTWLEIVAQKF
jgi:hypothetical protein